MTIFRILIAKHWFKTFFAGFFSLFLLFTIGDLVSGLLRSSVNFQEVLLNYVFKLPQSIAQILPVACLLATLFALNRLKTHSELVGILASGFSVKSVLVVILFCSSFIGAIQFFNLAVLSPYSHRIKEDFMNESTLIKFTKGRKKGLTSSITGGKVWYKGANYYVSYEAFDKAKNQLKGVTYYYFTPEYQAKRIIKAESAEYKEGEQWQLTDVTIVSNLENEEFQNVRKRDKLDLNLLEKPGDFKSLESDVSALGLRSLWRFINKLKKSGISGRDYEVIFYQKFSQPVLCVLFALLSMGILFSPNRRGSSFGKNVIFTILFTILFWLVQNSTLALGTSGKIPPFWAVLFIPLSFMIYECILVWRKA